MNFTKRLVPIVFATIVLLPSCTLQKRVYRKGYTISFNSNKHNTGNQKNDNISTDALDDPTTKDLSASISDNPTISLSETSTVLANRALVETCDNIILQNGEEIKCKVEDIGIDIIKYKKCENLTGPSYSIYKKDVFMIKYANGTKDILNPVKQKEEATKPAVEAQPEPPPPLKYYQEPSKEKEIHSTQAPANPTNNPAVETKTSIPEWIASGLTAIALICWMIIIIGLLAGSAADIVGVLAFCLLVSVLALPFDFIARSMRKKHPELYGQPKMGSIIWDLISIGSALLLLAII